MRVRWPQAPDFAAVLSCQNCAAGADDPAAPGIYEANAEQFFRDPGPLLGPGDAAIGRAQDRSLIADDPSRLFFDEGDRIQADGDA